MTHQLHIIYASFTHHLHISYRAEVKFFWYTTGLRRNLGTYKKFCQKGRSLIYTVIKILINMLLLTFVLVGVFEFGL